MKNITTKWIAALLVALFGIFVAEVMELFFLIPVLVLKISGCFMIFGSLIYMGKLSRYVVKYESRPIVHVWEHDGITRVMPDIDFELWHQLQERTKLVGIHNPYSRTDSEIKILFSDKPDNTHMYTGTMEQYERFVRGCQVRKSEKQITYYPVLDFQTAWELVHGENSTLPAE